MDQSLVQHQVDVGARLPIGRRSTVRILREAGYSEALLYKHFADKQEIYLAVLKERAGILVELLTAYLSTSDDDRRDFCFDPRVVDWARYVTTIHLPSVVRQAPDFCLPR